MQSHNLQHAPARYVLHFFQIFKEQTPANDITTMSIEKSAMKTRPAGHHHDLLLVSVHCDGGAGRDRTDDLRLAKPPLSQLSYSPLFFVSCLELPKQTKPKNLGGSGWIRTNDPRLIKTVL